MKDKPPRPTMEERVRALIQNRKDNPDVNLPNTNLFPELISCDEKTHTIELAYETHPWMTNPMGVVHGGVTGILVDNAMGISTCALRGVPTPTITMNINYLAPVPLNRTIIVRAQVVRIGETMAYTKADIYLPGRPHQPMVTATGVYYAKKA